MASEGYSPLLLEHFNNPRNVGVMENADAVGMQSNPVCGDTMRLMLRVDGEERIVEAKFQTVGCPAAIATSSAATELISGRRLGEVEGLTREEFAAAVGGLPPSKMHCSVLAADALRKAIADYRYRKERGG
ncbi:MAG: iron-sulfur cluster assembly scaffold protein [Dehalococcoidia bacterium]